MTLLRTPQYASIMRTAGLLLDIYDDPKASVLVLCRQGTQELLEKLGSAPSLMLNADTAAQLPDRLYALVAQDDDGIVRKYAMHDAGHVVTSTLYFLEQHRLLPEAAVKVAADRLIEGSGWYGIEPPEALVKLSTRGVEAPGADALRSVLRDGLSAAQERAIQEGKGRIEHGGAVAVKHQLELTATEENKIDNYDENPRGLQSLLDGLGEKKADLNGTEIMPKSGAMPKPIDKKDTYRMPSKTAVDLRGVAAPTEIKKTAYAVFALPHEKRYPLDTPALCKTAAAYFNEHQLDFSPFERRVFSHSLYTQAKNLGVKVAGDYLRYAGSEYGPHIGDQLLTRIRGFEGTGHEVVYEMLAAKTASIPPFVMAQLLEEADRDTGAASGYGRPGLNFLDPYAAVFGKAASDDADISEIDYTWQDGTDRVTGVGLMELSKKGARVFKGVFEDSFGTAFCKDPVGVFKSLPDPQKKFVARLIGSSAASVASV